MKKGCRLSVLVLILSLLLVGCVTELEQTQYAEPTPETSFFEPLSALSVPDEAVIVAFGEATHGSHEFKALAAEIFKTLVLEKGYRAFAIEAPFGKCVAINDYVLYGKGTARQAVAGNGFWVHNFQEVVDLVEWMREYNLTAEDGDKLRFYGLDIQETNVSGGLYLEFIQKVDAEKAKQYENAFGRVRNIDVYSVSEELLNIMLQNVETVITETEQNKEDYIKASSETDYEYALRNAVCVRNTIENALLNNYHSTSSTDNRRVASNYRDKCMSENVQWIVAQEESLGLSKVFVFAHNWHVQKSEFTLNYVMGRHLSDEYGDRYYVIGTNYYKSTFIAFVSGEGLKECTLVHDWSDLIKMFIDSNIEIGILDIRKILKAGTDADKLLGKLHRIGSIGSLYDPSYPATAYYEQIIPAAYDAMIFVRNATPATFYK